MEKVKLLTGIVLFGSLWGFLECTFGDYLHGTDLPAGIIMTAVFAMGLMMVSRLLYKQRGMQLGMGVIACVLRIANPFGGCLLCAAVAIMAEAAVFELIWLSPSFQFNHLENLRMKASMGIITAYCCYTIAYIATQIVTPFLSSAGFYLSDLIVFIPQILGKGTWAALIGGILLPVALTLKQVDISKIKDRIYYPTVAALTAFCWVIVIADTILFLSS